jgi:signal transduction histidine kinase/ligand-binding sensor domain-containing protein
MYRSAVFVYSSIATIILFISLQALGLDTSNNLPSYTFRSWQETEGLIQQTIYDITQTQDGYIWLGTKAGLCRFDGIRFTTWNSSNVPEIRDNEVNALAEDTDGSLLIGTFGGGLTRMKDGKFTTFTVKDGLPSDIIRVLARNRDGGIWIGTDKGLTLFKDGNFIAPKGDTNLLNNRVLDLYTHNDGTVIVALSKGVLLKLVDDKFIQFSPDKLRLTMVTGLPDGSIWASQRDSKEITLYKNGEFKTFAIPDVEEINKVRHIYADKSGTLWIGMSQGLKLFKNNKFFNYTFNGKDFNHNTIKSIFEDKEGILWIGTESLGLISLRRSVIKSYTSDSGLHGDVVQTIFEDRHGTIWIGTWDSLSSFKDGVFKSYTEKDGLDNRSINSIAEDRHGTLWVATSRKLYRLKENRFIEHKFSDEDNPDIRVLYFDQENNLWIGTQYVGLFLIKNGEIKNFRDKDGLASNSIRSIAVDKRGNIWIGTFGNGLSCYKDGKFQNFSRDNGLVNNYVMSLYVDEEDNLWIATRGGVNRYKEDKFTAYLQKDGLFDPYVSQIIESGQYLWMSCGRGIFKVRKQELNDYADGKIKRFSSIAYGMRDGMSSSACTSGFQPQGWKAKDGRLYFGTTKGFSVIDPDGLSSHSIMPPVHIEEIIVDHNSLLPPYQASPGSKNIEIHYTGLSFTAPERIEFKYQLEGFDKDWISAGNRRVAYYSNLPPGNYRFRVMASNTNGDWSDYTASVDISLYPYFYQTKWFYIFIGLLLVIITWSLHFLHIRQINAKHAAILEERHRIARDIHDTLAQGFAGISVQLEAIAHMLIVSPERVKDHINLARDLVRTSLREARKTVLDLRSSVLEKDDLVTTLTTMTKQLGTDLDVQVTITGTPYQLPKIIEHNLLRISQECITNTVKHAQASRLQINLCFESNYINLYIKDDGCGINLSTSPFTRTGHFGLIGIKERVEKLGGKLLLDTAPGKGTKYEISIPTSPLVQKAL